MKRWPGKFFCKFLFLITLGLFLSILAAQAGAAGDQETIALNFLRFLGSDKTIFSAERLEGNRLDPSLPTVTIGYLFHLDGGGYLLVSPDRNISPVKAYSLTGDFAALPPPYREALLAELELRARVTLAGTGRAPLDAAMPETEKQWDFLLRLDQMRLPLAYTAGTTLLQTKWNQGYPYNKFLPAIDGKTVPVGCVNVALAQVMRYHKYPTSSKGVVSYTWDGPPSQILKTILYRGYNWDNMPDTLDANTPEYQTDEVALLMKDLGIANQTNYDATGSSTSIRSSILTENFGYSTGLAQMGNAVFATFLATLQTEIQAERPVILSFVGQHMTVVDGYSADFGQKVHINMGWGGSADDFYFLDQPVSANVYTFPADAGNLALYYNLKPCSESAGDCAINLETGDAVNGLVITGKFNQAKDTDLYEVYLNGATTIRGTRGYSTLALYMSITGAADGGVVFPPPNPQAVASAGTDFDAGSLPPGKYTIRVSLCNETGSCYPVPLSGYENYTITLTSGALTVEERAAIDRGLDRSPVIGNALPDLLLNAAVPTIRRILIDARDENGDPVLLTVKNSNPEAVDASLNGNILDLVPASGSAKVSSQIVVTATANGKTTEKAFTVMTDDVETAFGKAFTVGGTFAAQDDLQTRWAILDGDCTITGSTIGFDNQYFYSTLRNASGGVLFAAGTDVIHSTFSRDRYILDASLKQNPGGYGSYYPYEPGKGDQYLLSVSCPNADVSPATIAGLLKISLAGAVWPGDINGDGSVTLVDAVLVMQMLSGMDMTGKTIILQADANGDHRIGLAEVIFILQRAVGLRSP
jgi:hypothetical protein